MRCYTQKRFFKGGGGSSVSRVNGGIVHPNQPPQATPGMNLFHESSSTSFLDKVISPFTAVMDFSKSLREEDKNQSPRGESTSSMKKKNKQKGVVEFWKSSSLDYASTSDEKQDSAEVGDAWPTALLRLKSFEDLQKLWFVLLKEKNLLLSEKHNAKKSSSEFRKASRLTKVKISQKRILTVLSERANHFQSTKAKEILAAQNMREKLEIERYHLMQEQKEPYFLKKERKQQLSRKKKSKSSNNESSNDEEPDIENYSCPNRLKEVNNSLIPLRKVTQQLLSPNSNWRYQSQYSDLPGALHTFSKDTSSYYVPGIAEVKRKRAAMS